MKYIKSIKIIFVFLYLILFKQIYYAQNNKELDSLKNILKTAKHDTTKIKTRIEIGENAMIFRIGYFDSIRIDCEKLINSSQNLILDIKYKIYLANSLNDLGYIYLNQGDNSKALDHYNRSLILYEKYGEIDDIPCILNSIGLVYQYIGDISKALEYYFKSLKIITEKGCRNSIATSLNNIGSIYCDIGDTTKALEYYYKSLKKYTEIRDDEGIAYSYNNIGTIYHHCNISKAIEYYNKSLIIFQKNGNKKGIANFLVKIGNIYYNQAKEAQIKQNFIKRDSLINKSLEYYNKSLNLFEQLEDKNFIVSNLINIGEIYFFKNDLIKAKSYALKSYPLAIELGFPNNIQQSASLLKNIYSKIGNYKKAFEYFKIEKIMQDSITNNENFKNIHKQQAKYEYIKKAALDSIANNKAMIIKNLEIGNQKTIIYFFVIGFLFVLIILFVIFQLFLQKRKGNIKLARQNIEIINQSNEIVNQRDKLDKQNKLLAEQKLQLEYRQIIIDKENADLKMKNMEAENQQLKQQIHPHFLFNSLNTLQTLVYEDPKIVEEYIINLSNFLRVSISSSNVNIVTIKEELKFCMNYLEMQKIRYEDALLFDISISEETQDTYSVPIFSIQQLLENSIKHNALTNKKPLCVKIYQQDDRIIVSNNIQEKHSKVSSTGIGLKNISERYKIISGDKVLINNENNIFSVSIKIISDIKA